MNPLEKNGEKFRLDTFLSARLTCIETINGIISSVEQGMNENDIKFLIETRFREIGVTKFWHPSKIRIAADTVKTFRALSDPDIRIQKGDICFLDLGPIIEDHEADFGRTFIFGDGDADGIQSKSQLIRASHEVFNQTAAIWKSSGLSGIELFQYASGLAKTYGFDLNPLMAGHRLGDFPHQLHSKAGLFEIDLVPTENLWVLEIHIIDEKSRRGAFFEDILLA